ncbi:MAG: RNase adapter RapZ [Alphaproteobacteria bacterium]
MPIVLVTGLSGAGKSSALKVLEDIGYEAVDNLPLFLLSRLVMPTEGSSAHSMDAHPLAIGADVRTRDFGIDAFLSETERLRQLPGFNLRKVFLDCDIDILCRRYTETRRRHPLAQDRPVRDGVERERELLAPLRDSADVVIDTSAMTLGELKQTLIQHFALDRSTGPGLFVQSFSYRGGVPRDADLVFDVRFLRNPYYVAELRSLTGQDPRVGAHIAADPEFDRFFSNLLNLLRPLLPRYFAEGKSYLTLAIGCTGGQHRSVYVAECLAAALRNEGQAVTVRHRDAGLIEAGSSPRMDSRSDFPTESQLPRARRD